MRPMDFIMVAESIDTAFTDFKTHVKFQTEYAGQHWSDSDAEFACLKRAMDQGIPHPRWQVDRAS